RTLLAEAGWKKNADGVLVNRHDQPFAFELLTNQGNDERKKVAEIVQASLKELGVQVDIRVIEWASFLKEYIKKRRFEAIVMGWASAWVRTSTRSGTRRRRARTVLMTYRPLTTI